MLKFKRLPLTAKNIKLLRVLQKACLPVDAPYLEISGWYWIGCWNNTPIAFCILAPSLQWSDCVYLARAGVLREFRGRGLQKRMITIRETLARKKGYVWSVSDTTENPASSNSLIAKGYKVYEPANPWGFKYSLYWRKKL